jgi:hypothetical protein
MRYFALFVLGASAYLYTAAQFQHQRNGWADQTCAGIQPVCDNAELLIAVIVLAVILFAASIVASS